MYKRMQADEIRPYRERNKATTDSPNSRTNGQPNSPNQRQTAGQIEQTKTKHYKNPLFVKETETLKPRQTQTETMKTQKRM